MINSIKTSLKLDISYAVNSFIYNLRRFPIFKDLITDDIYKSKVIKKIVMVITIILSILKNVIGKVIYLTLVFYLANFIFRSDKYFLHVFFIFSIIDILVNTKILATGSKKYISCILFNMDTKKYSIGSVLYRCVTELFYNIIGFILLNNLFNLDVKVIISLLILSFFGRFIGEANTMYFYRKNKYIWYYNTTLYFVIVIPVFLLSLLPLINTSINNSIIYISSIISIIIGIISIRYLYKVDDYKTINKIIYNKRNSSFSNDLNKSYGINEVISIKNKDKEIDKKKLEGKSGYELFNTIFYERHKTILLDSAFKFSYAIIGIYVVAIILSIINKGVNGNIHYLLNEKLGVFVFLMYFINRGSILTQAMFYNCDHAMLTYNFYRESNVIVNLFKIRLKSIIKINLVPALLIGVGNTILLYLTGGTSVIGYLSSFIYIIMVSVFFSVHYLVLYYLLSPFSKNGKYKSVGYLLAEGLTYYFSVVVFMQLRIDSLMLSSIVILFTLIYFVLSIFLVKRFAPRTFKLN